MNEEESFNSISQKLIRSSIEVSKQRVRILNLAELYNKDPAKFFYYIEKTITTKSDNKSDYFFAIGVLLNNNSYNELAVTSWEYAAKDYAKYGEKDQELTCYSYIGGIYYNLKDYANAIKFNLRASEIAKEVKDKSTEIKLKEAKCYSNIGNAFYALEEYPKAIEYYKQELEIAEELKDEEEKRYSYKGLGNAFDALGDYSQAIEYYEKASIISKKDGDRASEAMYYGSIGDIYNRLGDFNNALQYLLKELKIAKEINNKEEELACYVSLSNTYFDFISSLPENIGHYPYINLSEETIQKTFEYHKKALILAEKVGDEKKKSICHANLGRIFLFIYGDIPKAIQYYEKELAIRKKIKDRRGESKCYGNLGIAHGIMKDFPKAIQFNKKSLEIAEEIHDIDIQRITNLDLGRIYYQDSKLEIAYGYLNRSIELTEIMGEHLLEEYHKINFYGRTPAFLAYEDMILVCLNMKTKEKLQEAYQYLERSKSKAFIDLMSKSNIKPTKIEDTRMNELYQKEQELLMKKNDLNFRIDELNKIYDKMLDIDPEYVSLRRPQHLELNQLQDFIKERYNTSSILVEYFLTFEKLYIFLVTKDNLYIELVTELNSNTIQDYVDNYEKEVVNYPSVIERGEHITNNWLYGLSKYLIEPIIPYLQQENIDLICFVPHGIIHKLPLHALLLDIQQQEQEKQSQKPLIEKYKVVYSSSASLLQFHKSKRDKIQTCKAFGVAHNEFERSFEVEAERVAKHFGTEAKLGVTRQEIIDTHFTEDVLHFSCHGYFYPDDPLASGLVLKNEEFLTARDIFANNLKIDSQLVTLSACETGVSENRKGDELIGLARSFLYSGAQSLVMSLWKVNVQAALEIMEEFYNNLKNGEDKARALQNAQLKIRDEWKEKWGESYTHPFWWTPFVLVGDWR